MSTQAPDLHEEPGDGEQEVLQPMAQALDSHTVALLSKSEIDTQIATAKKYPRSITKLLNTARQLVTADAESADECIYALPRAGKIIEGPSVRFAEVMAYAWGNCRCGARVISEDAEFVTAMGSFIDLEANVAIGYEVKRRITNKKGERFSADVIQQTSNAACSIALRNATLRGIPKAIWRKVYLEARQAVAGDIKTLDSRRAAMMKAFQLMGIKPEQVFAKLEVKGVEDITLDHMVLLRGIYNSIRENETSAQRAFAPEQDSTLAEKSKANLDKIKEKYAQPAAEADPAYAEKLRKEADRQKKAVAEKYGASQPEAEKGDSAPAAGNTVASPATAADETAAPSEPQATGTSMGDSPEPAREEGPAEGGAKAGPTPDKGDEEHGIQLNFE
jgi:hypothetical protein